MNRRTSLAAILVLAVATTFAACAGESQPAPKTVLSIATGSTESLTLGGGCFWCLEAVYRELRGVTQVVSGYAGGNVDSPDYAQVSSGMTGHAEVVDITFDPKQVSRDDILHVYFTIHDPTTTNRQGADVGTQYRSVAFYRSPAQKAAIEQAIADVAASGDYEDPVVTQVVPFEKFWPAEDYHQQYYELNGEEPYCSLVIAPKIAKFRKKFAALLR
jgi:peptide-methionine (S)-S-oxide reductase